jgi:kynurenine formamidase
MKKIIDLTHTLTPDIPIFDTTGCGFELSIESDYKDCTPPDLFRAQKINSKAGIGTHMDAPAHCVEGGKTIEKIEMEELVAPCVVIDVSFEADQNYVVMPEKVLDFEKEYGEIPPKSFVIFYTGWDKHWGDPEIYRNNYKFPSISEATAKLLLERDIVGLGIDTLSSDTGAKGFPVHRAILGAGKYLVENIANAKSLPPTGAKIFVMPIKIGEGTEAPIRLVAVVS